MHELSLCQDLIDQLTALASTHQAQAVARVEVKIGTLSGIEARLLESAFTIARAGTVAENALLDCGVIEPLIGCLDCGRESPALPNDLRCPVCGSPATRLLSGDELILARVELVP